MADCILHEMGHVIGLNQYSWESTGILKIRDDGRKVLSGLKCRAACGNIMDSAPVDVPLFILDNYQHIDEASFSNEIMSPGISTAGNLLSELTGAILEDMGYTVDYENIDQGTIIRSDGAEFGLHGFICGLPSEKPEGSPQV